MTTPTPEQWPVDETEEDPIDDPDDDENAGEPDEYIEQAENAEADNDESDP